MKSKIVWKVINALLSLCMALVLINSLLSYDVIALNKESLYFHTVIVILFGFEYIYKLVNSGNKKEYLKHNIVNLMSIIPYNIYFTILSLCGIGKYFTITRQIDIVLVLLVAVYLLRFNSIIKELCNKNKIIYMCILTAIIIIIGALLISIVENISLADALWWSFVTFTTVGYGDVTLYTPLGRIIGVILMIVGIGVIGVLTSTIAVMIFFGNKERNNESYKDEIIIDAVERIKNFDELKEEDLECIFKSLMALKGRNSEK